MIGTTTGRRVSGRPAKPSEYCICLKICPSAREDAWDLCQTAMHYGGIEVQDCCFTFATEERGLAALEAICFQFGPEYLEVSRSMKPHEVSISPLSVVVPPGVP